MQRAERGPGTDAPDPARWRILAVLLGAIFMSLVAVSIVNVALPSMQAGLGASNSDLQWVLSGYALTFGVVLVAAGRAGDVLGRGGIFLLGVVIFTASSIACSVAPSAEWLNIARFVQGVGSGLINPQGVGMIQQYFSGAERARAFGAFGSAVGVSVAVGPVIGGGLIELGGMELGWRLTFLVNVPIGVVTIVLALLWFPRPLFRRGTAAVPEAAGDVGHGPRVLDAEGICADVPGGRGEARHPGLFARVWRTMDPLGAVLLGGAVLAILFPFMESRSTPMLWLLLPLGLVLVLLWLWWERRCVRHGRSPMVDLGIFRTRSFTNGTVMITLYFLGMTSVWVLVALYMQQGAGRSALEAGLVGLPSSILAALSANWAGKRVLRHGRRLVIGGLCVALAGLGLSIGVVLLHDAAGLSIWWWVLTLSLVGIAQGTVVSPNQTLTLAEVPLAYAGSSGAVMQTGQRIGTSIGIAVITAAVFGMLQVGTWANAAAVGFGLIGVVVLAALAVAYKDLRDRRAHDTPRA